jgi:hypothetical protein
LGDHFNVGLDVRYSDADADLSSDEELPALTVDTGSVHYGIALGYHW